jgi:hypothetical protein
MERQQIINDLANVLTVNASIRVVCEQALADARALPDDDRRDEVQV